MWTPLATELLGWFAMSRFCDKKRRLDEKEKNVNNESKTKGTDHLVDFFNPQKDHCYTGRNDDKRSRFSKTPFWPQNIAVLQNC